MEIQKDIYQEAMAGLRELSVEMDRMRNRIKELEEQREKK